MCKKIEDEKDEHNISNFQVNIMFKKKVDKMNQKKNHAKKINEKYDHNYEPGWTNEMPTRLHTVICTHNGQDVFFLEFDFPLIFQMFRNEYFPRKPPYIMPYTRTMKKGNLLILSLASSTTP